MIAFLVIYVALACAWDVGRRTVPIWCNAAGALIVLFGVLWGLWSWSPIAAVLAFAAVALAGMGWGDRWAALILGGLCTALQAGAALLVLLGALLAVRWARPSRWVTIRTWPALPFLVAALAVSWALVRP